MLADVLNTLSAQPALRALAGALAQGQRVVATGSAGSSAAFTAGALARELSRPILLVLAHLDDAEEALDELAQLQGALNVLRLPALESLPGESSASLELFAERLSVIKRAVTLDERAPAVVIAPIPALMQLVPPPGAIDRLLRVLEVGQDHKLTDLVRWLESAGYRRVEAVEEPGDFALRGGILDVFPPGAAPEENIAAGRPVRLDFFGDTIDRIAEIDPDTMATDRAVRGVQLVCADLDRAREAGEPVSFTDLLPRACAVVLHETLEVVEQARGYFERVLDAKGIEGPPAALKRLSARFGALAELNQFSAGAASADVRIDVPVSPLPPLPREAPEAIKEIAALPGRVVLPAHTPGDLARVRELIAQHAPEARARLEPFECYVHRGFALRAPESDQPLLTVVPYHELVGREGVRRRRGGIKSARAIDTFLDFQPDDYVVHTDHGIAIYRGLALMKPRDLPGTQAPTLPTGPGVHLRPEKLKKKDDSGPAPESEEYLILEFAAKSRLYVPATQIDLVQRYVGGFSGKPPLSILGGQRWKSQVERVSASVRDLAAELLRVRAARQHMPGVQYPPDTMWQNEFEAAFPYEETEDQLAALGAIKKDMQSARPMDRLICGDVGFGKTELAIRAAFKAAEAGKQVAVLVPTTVLAEQHERTFRARFAGYPFRVESLSRFKTDGEAREILQKLAEGAVDIVIGTHRILSQDVVFKELGLVIIDEEQRFGVEHKERLLRLRLTVDVLTLSATPIPRTLHMAMLGIRDISSLATPPLDRRAIVTEVIPYNEKRVSQAIARELAREGQVYYVHNRVYDIQSVADQVLKLSPEGTRIVVGHGQMSPHDLEEVMLKFMRRQADILVSTTIIESGIDNPTANTIIIDHADRFGLAELHQLRGRVGRSKHRAYCYLLLPPDRTVKEIAQKRLKALEQYAMLGAGFKIAMRDLEIRGAGNLLGAEQSGHIAAVGYDLYCQLLERAVTDLTTTDAPEPPSRVAIEVGLSASIPRPYIPSDQRRLEAYRRLATSATFPDLDKLRATLTEAYGAPPKPVQRLLDLAQLRIALANLRARGVTLRGKDLVFRTPHAQPLAQALGQGQPELVTVLPARNNDELAEVYFRPPPAYLEPETLLAVLRKKLVPPEHLPKEAPPKEANVPRSGQPGAQKPGTKKSGDWRSAKF
ncbi:MAG: transcription-repair coupling factor [Planctomycetota bacterium]|nr:transcription-repair coupling factor [Planctomycetota bacterium]